MTATQTIKYSRRRSKRPKKKILRTRIEQRSEHHENNKHKTDPSKVPRCRRRREGCK